LRDLIQIINVIQQPVKEGSTATTKRDTMSTVWTSVAPIKRLMSFISKTFVALVQYVLQQKLSIPLWVIKHKHSEQIQSPICSSSGNGRALQVDLLEV
jgi:hypothetical protein